MPWHFRAKEGLNFLGIVGVGTNGYESEEEGVDELEGKVMVMYFLYLLHLVLVCFILREEVELPVSNIFMLHPNGWALRADGAV